MRISRSDDASFQPVDADNFEGAANRRDMGRIGPQSAAALVVRFEAGARTHWHRHADGQMLYVLEGSGRVGTRDGTVERIGPGDFVHAEPGEEHWHGAADDAGVTHVALSFGDTEWVGPRLG
jgi:quercetin dioxygenase-like cupin family protein